MQNIIIGTAGHVDHGKTFLIKALSGIDTDRLKEEKKRGITIENGFANLQNDMGYHLGIIDVPGHEKFVKNMLSGIGGIDIVLLVISLEEGIKPQTIEHFEIIKSLGIKKGIIVLTKLDTINDGFNIDDYKVNGHNDTLKSEIENLCKNSFLADAHMIAVSSLTLENIDKLKVKIYEKVKEIGERNNQKELTRLPIDRVFTMEGHGTVVTGTLMEGKIEVSDTLMLYPKQKLVKIRQIQSHGENQMAAYAGQRTAINLLNIKKEEIERGDVLATAMSIILSDTIDCYLTMFDSAKRMIKNGERVHFNYGSMQTEATVKIINDNEKNSGKLFVQYKFENEIPVKRNDRYIIRFMSPASTCGGGIILNVDAKKQKINSEISLNHFNAISSNDEKEVLVEMVNESSFDFPNISYMAKKMNMSIDDTKKICETLDMDKNEIIIINEIILSSKFYEGIKKYLVDVLTKFHKDNPLLKGMKKEELKSTLFKRYVNASETIIEKLIDYMININLIKQVSDTISLYEFNVVIDDKKAKLINEIEDKFKSFGYEPPMIQDFVNEYKAKKYDGLQIRQIINDFAKNGKLVKLSSDYYMHSDHFNKAISIMTDFLNKNEKIMMKDLRDLLDTSRKYAILIIDYCDIKKITKLVGDYRVLFKK